MFAADAPRAPVTPTRRTAMIDRLAIVGSPRSGNVWIRSILARHLDLAEIAVFNYRDAPDPLPARCLVQTHWYREPNFQQWLGRHGFAKLCIARHPLDILLSVLHFVRHEPTTGRWLEGNAGLPPSLATATPASPEFLDYALSFGAENLLSPTYQWWHDPSAYRLRYEESVADPVRVLGDLVHALGGDPRGLGPLIEAFSVARRRGQSNWHVWRGRPNSYRSFLPYGSALRIRRRHRRYFDVLGYGVPPYWLSGRRADLRWAQTLRDESAQSDAKQQ